jgi:hypothetical protein
MAGQRQEYAEAEKRKRMLSAQDDRLQDWHRGRIGRPRDWVPNGCEPRIFGFTPGLEA